VALDPPGDLVPGGAFPRSTDIGALDVAQNRIGGADPSSQCALERFRRLGVTNVHRVDRRGEVVEEPILRQQPVLRAPGREAGVGNDCELEAGRQRANAEGGAGK
jgi:hypothetical protein